MTIHLQLAQATDIATLARAVYAELKSEPEMLRQAIEARDHARDLVEFIAALPSMLTIVWDEVQR